VHNLRDWKTQLAYARELKTRGKTKYIGLTHYVDGKHDELADIMAAEKPDFIQINYSVSTTNAEKRLLPLARDTGVAVMINRAFDDGRLFAHVAGKALSAGPRMRCDVMGADVPEVRAQPSCGTVVIPYRQPTTSRPAGAVT
jgi:aryl-alcohol dehydrogenase-like predicted oxidoreductase